MVSSNLSNSFQLQSIAKLPTQFGEFKAHSFVNGKQCHLALTYGTINNSDNPTLVRVHSQCLTGDALLSLRCDCNAQLQNAMQKIVANKSGLIIYLLQEGRGIGIGPKIAAYALQDTGLDTVEANLKLGFAKDLRNYDICRDIFEHFNIAKIALMTNNPDKIRQIGKFVKVEAVAHKYGANTYNKEYLNTKKQKLNHDL